MKPLTFVVLLQLFGVAVVIAEIILPSGGLLSVIAAGLFGYSLYVAFQDLTRDVGIILLFGDILIIPVIIVLGLKLLARTPVTLRKTLSRGENVTSQPPELEKYLGKGGVAATDLRPSGTAYFDDKRMDVVTQGEYLEKGREIVVYKVEGNQLIVKERVTLKGENL